MEKNPSDHSAEHRSPYYIRSETIKALGEYSAQKFKKDFDYIARANPDLAAHLRSLAFTKMPRDYVSGIVAGVVQTINWLEYQNAQLDSEDCKRFMDDSDDAALPPSGELDDDPPSDGPSQGQADW